MKCGQIRSLLLTGMWLVICCNFVMADDNCKMKSVAFNEILSKLKTFSNQNTKPECKTINDDADALMELLRDESQRNQLDVTTWVRNENGSISRSQIDNLAKYSDSVTRSVAALITSLNNDDQNCFSTQDRKTAITHIGKLMQSMAGVTAMIGSKYSIPITLGGTLLGSVLVAIDDALHSGMYQFDNDDTRSLYINFACTFVEYQKQVDRILNAKKYLAPLEAKKALIANAQNLAGADNSLKCLNTCSNTGSCRLNDLGEVTGQIKNLLAGNNDEQSEYICQQIQDALLEENSKIDNIHKTYFELAQGNIKTRLENAYKKVKELAKNLPCDGINAKILTEQTAALTRSLTTYQNYFNNIISQQNQIDLQKTKTDLGNFSAETITPALKEALEKLDPTLITRFTGKPMTDAINELSKVLQEQLNGLNGNINELAKYNTEDGDADKHQIEKTMDCLRSSIFGRKDNNFLRWYLTASTDDEKKFVDYQKDTQDLFKKLQGRGLITADGKINLDQIKQADAITKKNLKTDLAALATAADKAVKAHRRSNFALGTVDKFCQLLVDNKLYDEQVDPYCRTQKLNSDRTDKKQNSMRGNAEETAQKNDAPAKEFEIFLQHYDDNQGNFS